jgi:hypothetical protein
MADTKTYKEGDAYELKYDDAPRPPEKRHKAGQQLPIRGEKNVLLALWEVETVDENGAKGKVLRVFQVKTPTDPDPRQTGPLPNKRTKPL